MSYAKPLRRMVIVLMDTTYWSRNFGVMLFKNAITKENLLKYYVRHETNALYTRGIACDGRKDHILSFLGLPVQMCQFHQAAIIRRYLTRKPKLQNS